MKVASTPTRQGTRIANSASKEATKQAFEEWGHGFWLIFQVIHDPSHTHAKHEDLQIEKAITQIHRNANRWTCYKKET